VIGPEHYYTRGSEYDKATYSFTLLAFAFTDSTGVWGAAGKVAEPNNSYETSDQQLCVQDQSFMYTRPTSPGEPAKECDRGLPGYYRIPGSIAYYGETNVLVSHKTLHVSFGPRDRAIPLGSHGLSQTSHTPSGNSGSPSTIDDSSVGAVLLKEFAQALSQAGATASKRPLSPSMSAAQQVQAHTTMLGWVREDVAAYVAESRNRFEAYKKGQPQISQGLRMWDSSVKPAFAKGCWVVQGETTTTFSCLLSETTDLKATLDEYTELTFDVAAALPPDWHPEAAAPFGPDFPASKGYRSSSGSHGEIWIERAASDGGYKLQYQLVTAAVVSAPAAHPARPAEPGDDPIGAGGFITPPARKP
jgi:hypothetical protein